MREGSEMKKAKSNMKKLINGLNEMADEEQFNYKKAIIAEDRKFERGSLKARQKKVVANLEKEFGVGLTNSKEGGKKMTTQKGGVKTKVATKKVVPPKVDLKKVEENAIRLLNELKGAVSLNGINDLKMVPTSAGYVSYKIKNRIIFGMRYSVNGKNGIYFKLTEKQFKEQLPKIKGSFINQFAEYVLPSEKDILVFKPLAELAISNIPKPKAKVVKPVVKKAVKKNKEIKRII